jgi:hypothetical protein
VSEDLTSVRDDLEADMAAHEARRGEVHADRNRALAADALRQLERERAGEKPVQADHNITNAPAREVQHKDIDGKRYTLDKAPDKPMFRTASEFETNVLKHAQPRLAMLMSKQDSGPLGTPSWRAKTLAAMYFKVKSLEAKAAKQIDLETYYELAYQQDLTDLLESSNQIFGDWRKTPDPIT